MKYKRLSEEELKPLEKEFINFLSSAQVTGPDWEKMKKEDKEQAEELIDVFSDMVYEKVMGKIKYLEFRDKKTLNVFSCQDDKIDLIGLRVKDQSSLDFTDKDVFTNWNDSDTASIEVVKSEKKYAKERGVEVFELLQTGCYITDDKIYNLLAEMT